MNFEKMTKKELIQEIENLQGTVLDLQTKIAKTKTGDGRKSQVLDLLRKSGSISILEIADKLKISAKNVSSQLTYLRTDGFQIFTDPKGRKVLVETKKIETPVEEPKEPEASVEELETLLEDPEHIKDEDNEFETQE